MIHHFYSETKDWNFGLNWTLFKYERSIDQKWHLFSRQKYDLILWGKKCPVWPHLVPAWLADPPSYNDPPLLCLLLPLLSTSWPDTWLSLPSSTGDLDSFWIWSMDQLSPLAGLICWFSILISNCISTRPAVAPGHRIRFHWIDWFDAIRLRWNWDQSCKNVKN